MYRNKTFNTISNILFVVLVIGATILGSYIGGVHISAKQEELLTEVQQLVIDDPDAVESSTLTFKRFPVEITYKDGSFHTDSPTAFAVYYGFLFCIAGLVTWFIVSFILYRKMCGR